MKKLAETPELNYDQKWRDMYKVGSISCIIVSLMILFAVIAFFIWPYAALDQTTEEIYTMLYEDMWGGLVSLDLLMLITMLINLLPLLAFYIALRKVNETYALISLVLGLIAIATVIPARPLVEMALLSEKFATANNEADKHILLASGEVFRLLFDGTAWLVQTVLLLISGLIYSILMIHSDVFNKKLAYTGIAIALFGLAFWLPGVGIFFLFLNTVLTIPWYLFIARAFARYGWKN